MIEDFFNEIKVPEFLRGEFDKDDWYLLIAKAKKILSKILKDNELAEEYKQMVLDKTLRIHNQVYIGKTCIIGDFIVIEGPVYIGDNVEIGPGAYIRQGSIISDNCSVGHAAQVKNTLMMEGSKVSNHAFVGDSIIGANARIAGHCETANRRFDQQEIEFNYRETKLFTGLDKLGLILGEGSRMGGGVYSSPGTMVGKNTFIMTATTIEGFIEPNKFVRSLFEHKIIDNRFVGKIKHTNLFDKA